MINPHNPEFITKRPWYLGESGPSLVHHSKQKVDAVLTMKKADELVQQRWATKKKVATGYRKVRRCASRVFDSTVCCVFFCPARSVCHQIRQALPDAEYDRYHALAVIGSVSVIFLNVNPATLVVGLAAAAAPNNRT